MPQLYTCKQKTDGADAHDESHTWTIHTDPARPDEKDPDLTCKPICHNATAAI